MTIECPNCHSSLGPHCACRGEYRMKEPEHANLWSQEAFEQITEICNKADASMTKWKYSYVHDLYFNKLSKEEFEKTIVKFNVVDFQTFKIAKAIEMVPYQDGYIRACPVGCWSNELILYTKTGNPRLYKSYEEACLDLLNSLMQERQFLKFKLRKVKNKIRVLNKKIVGIETS